MASAAAHGGPDRRLLMCKALTGAVKLGTPCMHDPQSFRAHADADAYLSMLYTLDKQPSADAWKCTILLNPGLAHSRQMPSAKRMLSNVTFCIQM